VKQTANGNYLWLVLLAFFLVLPAVNSFTHKTEPQKPFETNVESAEADLPHRK
jgi:hypothetical protein